MEKALLNDEIHRIKMSDRPCHTDPPSQGWVQGSEKDWGAQGKRLASDEGSNAGRGVRPVMFDGLLSSHPE